MKLPRNLSGQELVEHLIRHWDYEKVHQVGSHVILQTQHPSPHRIAIPAHKPLKIGTLNGILRAVAVHKQVSREDVLNRI